MDLAVAVEQFVSGNDAEKSMGFIKTNVRSVEGLIKDQLGPFLTSVKENVRGKAIELLAGVVEVGTNEISDNGVISLTDFVKDRMVSDYFCTAQLVQLAAAVSKRNVENFLVCQKIYAMIELVYEKVNCQALAWKARNSVYSMLAHALKSNSKIKVQFSMFKKLIQAMEGEKDPRNLIVCFRLVSALYEKFGNELERDDELCEEIFDGLIAYFPVTFTAPKDDPYGITGDDLIIALRDALSWNSAISMNAIPFLLDKLSSAPPSAHSLKSDVFLSLKACILRSNYLAKISAFFREIVDACFNEILHQNDTSEIVVDSALELLCSISKVAFNEMVGDAYWNSIGNYALECCLNEFSAIFTSPSHESAQNSLKKSAIVSSKILAALSVSYWAFEKCLSGLMKKVVIPALSHGQFSFVVQEQALSIRKDFFEYVIEFTKKNEQIAGTIPTALQSLLNGVLNEILESLSKSYSFIRIKTLSSLLNLMAHFGFFAADLDSESKKAILDLFKLLNQYLNDENWNECLEILVILVDRNIAIAECINLLCSSNSNKNANLLRLNELIDNANSIGFFNSLTNDILKDDTSSGQLLFDSKQKLEILNHICNSANSKNYPDFFVNWGKSLIMFCKNLDYDLVMSGPVYTLLVTALSNLRGNLLLVQDILSNHLEIETDCFRFVELGIISSLSSSILNSMKSITNIWNKLCNSYKQNSADEVVLTIATILNKSESTDLIRDFVHSFADSIQLSDDHALLEKTIEKAFIFTRALMMASKMDLGNLIFEKIVVLISKIAEDNSENQVISSLCSFFPKVIQDSASPLTKKEFGCRSSLLFKQKYISRLLPLLIDNSKSYKDSNASLGPFGLAIVFVLAEVPDTILKDYISVGFQSVVQSLEDSLSDPACKLSSLNLLKRLVI
jgi:hypothetical protein